MISAVALILKYLASKTRTRSVVLINNVAAKQKSEVTNGGAIHRMFNEAQPAGIAADKERQYRGKL